MHHTYLAGSGLSAETVKQLQQSVKRKGGAGAGAIGTSGEEALDALRSKRVKKQNGHEKRLLKDGQASD
jgi:hypothetical protein